MTFSLYVIIFLIIVIVGLALLWWNEKRKRTKNAVEKLNNDIINMISKFQAETHEMLTYVRNDVNRLDNHFNNVTKAITKTFEKGTKKMKEAASSLGFDKDII